MTTRGIRANIRDARARMRGTNFFSSVPNGIFNLASSYLDLKEFGRLHQVFQSNKQCNAH